MLTGTPLDLTPFGAVLQGIGLLYWLFVIAVLIFVLTNVKGRLPKTLSAIAVLVVMAGPVVLHVMKRLEQQQEAKAKLDAAMAHFEMRCKSAGEKITKVVEDVDGIVWMKWRTEEINFGDQFKLDDPYGADCRGEECIKKLLRVTRGGELDPDEAKQHAQGYRYVETTNPNNGMRYRYVGVIKSIHTRTPEQIKEYIRNTGIDPGAHVYGFELERHHIDHYSARYGVTWEDISTIEDREFWVAGGALKVVNLQTNQVLAERLGFMIDKGLGSTAGFRQPWSFAQDNACPKHYQGTSVSYSEKTLPFITKIIIPSK